ncbi:MAG: ribonuclease P protein component [Proteobacteria bacterium]|nr:ribonuclease P protein component [Pseudomonadota bacterium]
MQLQNFIKTDRILKRHEFIELSKKGKRTKNKYVTAIYFPGSTGKCRLGLTVTKKTGNSVQRNRLKRYVREFFRVNKSKFNYNWDINIIANKESVYISSEKMFLSLHEIFKKIEEGFDN